MWFQGSVIASVSNGGTDSYLNSYFKTMEIGESLDYFNIDSGHTFTYVRVR